MQKTEYKWNLFIADDYSTDGTREIILEYKNKFPDKIELILQSNNVGAAKNWFDLIKAPRSKYIAYFEGDDYWIDNNKIQLQTNFLESNPDYSICFHRTYDLYGDREIKLSPLNKSDQEETYTINDLAVYNFINTVSCVYRNDLMEFPPWFHESPVGDYVLHLLNAQFGKIKYFPQPMAVYRKHYASIWGSKSEKYQIEKWLCVLQNLIKEFQEPIAGILKKQYAQNAMQMSHILHEEGLDGKSMEYFKLAEQASADAVRDWAFDKLDRYNKIFFSKEYQVGRFTRNPMLLLKTIARKLSG